jgi:biopolymer transport protein ExbB/TolQ
MTHDLLALATRGSAAILYLLIGLSLLSVAVVVERLWLYWRARVDLSSFLGELVEALNRNDDEVAIAAARRRPIAAEAQVALEGLANRDKGGAVAQQLMDAMVARQRQRLDRRLSILGTIGSNAPFIGLLGTVMGIIKAFHDLSLNSQGGPSVVMAGIGEALVATAVGLVVAIPAVVAFNAFKSRGKRIASNMEQVERTLRAMFDASTTARES